MSHWGERSPLSCAYNDFSSKKPHAQRLLHLPQRLTIRLDSQGESPDWHVQGPLVQDPQRGDTYKTRKRDIVALLMAGDRSLGQWVNYHTGARRPRS